MVQSRLYDTLADSSKLRMNISKYLNNFNKLVQIIWFLKFTIYFPSTYVYHQWIRCVISIFTLETIYNIQGQIYNVWRLYCVDKTVKTVLIKDFLNKYGRTQRLFLNTFSCWTHFIIKCSKLLPVVLERRKYVRTKI